MFSSVVLPRVYDSPRRRTRRWSEWLDRTPWARLIHMDACAALRTVFAFSRHRSLSRQNVCGRPVDGLASMLSSGISSDRRFAASTIAFNMCIGIQSQRHRISLSCDRMKCIPYWLEAIQGRRGNESALFETGDTATGFLPVAPPRTGPTICCVSFSMAFYLHDVGGLSRDSLTVHFKVAASNARHLTLHTSQSRFALSDFKSVAPPMRSTSNHP